MSLNFDFWVPPYDYHPPLSFANVKTNLWFLLLFLPFLDFFSFFFLTIGLLYKGRGNTVFCADFGNMLNCKPEYDAGIDLLTIQVIATIRIFNIGTKTRLSSSYLDCELSCNPWRHQSTFPVLVTTGTSLDILSSLLSSWNQVPKNYEKCPFYFWFHTAFVKDNSLILTRYDDDRHQSYC